MTARVIVGLLVAVAVLGWPALAVAAEGGGGHGEVSLNPVAPEAIQADLAIWTAVVFLILLAILWAFAWGPIKRGLDRREEAIADEIREAAESNQQARELLAQYEQKLAESRNEVRRILEEARRNAEKAGQQIVEKARAEAQGEADRAREEIEAATSSALEDIARQSATLAVELAGKIVHSQLDARSHSKLIEQAMAKFPEGTAGEN